MIQMMKNTVRLIKHTGWWSKDQDWFRQWILAESAWC